MRRLAELLLLSLLAAACASPLGAPPSSSATAAPSSGAGGTPTAVAPAVLAADRIQLLHTDDIHGHLAAETVGTGSAASQQGGAAQLAAQIAVARARAPERTLLLDAGDAWQGTFISNVNKGAAVTRAMTLMRYDALTVGNHDFDWGQDVLAARATEASFPFLGANVVETASGRSPPYLRPYVVKDLGIAKVAVLGITNPQSATIVKATSVAGLTFLSAAATARRYVPELRAQADVVVVVAHVGTTDAMELARDVPGIDIIVASHDHAPLQTARLQGTTTIVNSGAYTQYFGRLEILVDPATHRLKDTVRAGVLVPVASSAGLRPDPAVAAIVEAERAAAEKYTARVVGTVRSFLPNPREECGLGNLITDALLDYGRQQGWKSEVAFYNMAGVRAAIGPGEITYGRLYEVLPFGNAVVSVDLSGVELREVLEDASGRAGRLHIAGGRWVYRYEAPSGYRVLEATVAGAAIDPQRTYHVVTIDYLLLGGDGHTHFSKGTNVIYGDVEVDAVAAYMSAHTPLDPRVEGRITQR